MKALGLIDRIEPYRHSVGVCYRCKTVVEPLVSKQWYVRTKPLAEPAIKAVRSGRIKIIPRAWSKTYFHWMENIRDWAISRQLWWGHRIPVWYCDRDGSMHVSRTDLAECPQCRGPLRQDTDVLDTWFSSGLWPFSTLGWPESTPELKVFYPTSVLSTGFDILFFWVARMAMLGIKFMGDVPFHHVYIHALVRDADGQKMSKSKGNVVDPLSVMDRYGTDAFRFTLAALAAQGRDIRLAEERIEGYRNFANKIWNAARLVLANLEGYDPALARRGTPSVADRWIKSRLTEAIAEVRKAIDTYRFNDAASAVYQFLWHEFCDWYIELIKPELYQEKNPAQKWLAQKVLSRVLDVSLRLLHPFMPFITEEIWQNLPGNQGSIMVSEFPKVEEGELRPEEEAEMGLVMGVIGAVRNLRSELNIPPAKKVEMILHSGQEKARKLLEESRVYIESLARTSALTIEPGGEKPKGSATAIVEAVEVFLPLRGIIDLEGEEKRLQKELAKIGEDLGRTHLKLHNRDFLEKAKAEAVEKEREKVKNLSEREGKLKESLARVQGWRREG
jgi:valyl-tRNA synthetase